MPLGVRPATQEAVWQRAVTKWETALTKAGKGWDTAPVAVHREYAAPVRPPPALVQAAHAATCKLLATQNLRPASAPADRALSAYLRTRLPALQSTELYRLLTMAVDTTLSYEFHLKLGIHLAAGYLAGQVERPSTRQHLRNLIDGYYRPHVPEQHFTAPATQAAPYAAAVHLLFDFYRPGGPLEENLFALSGSYHLARAQPDPEAPLSAYENAMHLCMDLCQDLWNGRKQADHLVAALPSLVGRVVDIELRYNEAQIVLALVRLGEADWQALQATRPYGSYREVWKQKLQAHRLLLEKADRGLGRAESLAQSGHFDGALDALKDIKEQLTPQFASPAARGFMDNLLEQQIAQMAKQSSYYFLQQPSSKRWLGRSFLTKLLQFGLDHKLQPGAALSVNMLLAPLPRPQASAGLPGFLPPRSASPTARKVTTLDSDDGDTDPATERRAADADAKQRRETQVFPPRRAEHAARTAQQAGPPPVPGPWPQGGLAPPPRPQRPERMLSGTSEIDRVLFAMGAAQDDAAAPTAAAQPPAIAALDNGYERLLRQIWYDHQDMTAAEIDAGKRVCLHAQATAADRAPLHRLFAALHDGEFLQLAAAFLALQERLGAAPKILAALQEVVAAHLLQPARQRALNTLVQERLGERDVLALRPLKQLLGALPDMAARVEQVSLQAFLAWQPRWTPLSEAAQLLRELESATWQADHFGGARTTLEHFWLLEGPATDFLLLGRRRADRRYTLGPNQVTAGMVETIDAQLDRGTYEHTGDVTLVVEGALPAKLTLRHANGATLHAYRSAVAHELEFVMQDPQPLHSLRFLHEAGKKHYVEDAVRKLLPEVGPPDLGGASLLPTVEEQASSDEDSSLEEDASSEEQPSRRYSVVEAGTTPVGRRETDTASL